MINISKNRKNKEVLINPTEKEMLEREPLMAFSFYLSGRNNLLLSLLDEIIENMDLGFLSNPINKNGLIEKASGQIWFWILGAYEVIRTISQAKICFSDEFNLKIVKLKKDLAVARMPGAKMEKTGKKIPVGSNRSPDGWDFENKDLLIGEPENPVSVKTILKCYDEIMTSLALKDILKRHEESY